ncbi:Hsp70 family protein [Streptomyces erythrochromogenes]|uniref:Hsp70 family protein n=1 Tax=Streptomyces erythrochromogenes TaxID=285574 RepID=A0ABZ1Q7W1_9ACTN|nr:Hsp70 family protein [Streptomyces erythrochromogenes]
MTYRVVAAIDFGTHGSGFAWAVLPAGADAPGERQIDYPDQWDDAPLTYPKNLSALFLDPDGNDRHWGYSARRASAAEEEGRLEHGFKMWLRREGRDAARDPGAGLVGTPERAVPLIAAYLRRLRGAALDRIVGGGGFLESDIRWCLTVPAIWEPEERNLMREAARQAGFPAHDRNRLILVTEPEAATVYCAQDAAAGIGGLGSLATLVVDCGGGTVDIAAYRCRRDGSLEQLRPPSGGKLGSNFINRRFQVQVLRPRLGQAAFKALEAAPAQLMELMDAFERLKTGFRDGDSAVRIPISLKASRIIDPHGGSQRLAAEQQGVDDHIVIEPDVMRGLFQGTTEPLQKLVSTQIRELLADPAVAAEGLRVILVGGFAQSPYVQSRLGQHIDKEFPAGVQLMIPPNPSRAVLGGAVHYACRPEVVHSRRASHTYAVEVSTRRRFGGVLRESGAVRALGITRVRGQGAFRDGVLDPLVLMGESVRVGSERTHSLLPLSKEQSELEVALYAVPAVKGLTVKTPGARLLGTVVVDIRDSVGEDVEDRVVDLHFTFGGTEIGVTVVNRRTQARLDTVVEFAGVPE